MTDRCCCGCEHRGDLEACWNSDCHHPKTWMAKALAEYLKFAIDALGFYADEEAWVRVYSADGASWRRPPAHRDQGRIARRALRTDLSAIDSRLARLERFAARVLDELNDPMAERWCDQPDDDRGLLESLRAEAERVVEEGREEQDAEF